MKKYIFKFTGVKLDKHTTDRVNEFVNNPNRRFMIFNNLKKEHSDMTVQIFDMENETIKEIGEFKYGFFRTLFGKVFGI